MSDTAEDAALLVRLLAENNGLRMENQRLTKEVDRLSANNRLLLVQGEGVVEDNRRLRQELGGRSQAH